MGFLSKLLPGLFKPEHPKKELSPAEFMAYYIIAFKARFPDVRVTENDDFSFSTTTEDTRHKHYFDNMYDEYKGAPDSLDSVVTRYLDSASGVFVKEALSTDRIVPVIKPVEYKEYVAELAAEKGGRFLFDPYNDQLVIAYAYDGEHSLHYLKEDDIENLGLSPGELREVALENLEKVLPNIERHGGDGFYMLTAGGNFEACLILLSSIWTTENFPVEGDLIIAIPNRDMLLITGSNHVDHLAGLTEMTANSFNDGSYPVSPYLYKWNGEKFIRIY